MRVLPPKQRATVGPSSFEYTVSGAGRPAVVLVNGAGGPIEGWFKVLPPLESLSTVFAYNRAGIGGSGRPSEPQTGDVVVASLRALLAEAGLSAPHVLVGHSLGGLHVNLFARRFPHEVAGVVLLEASAPDDVSLMSAQRSVVQRAIERALDAVFGKDTLGETAHVARTVELIRDAGHFPDVPLVVVSGGRPAMSWLTPAQVLAARAANQQALSALSPRGRRVVAARSGHFPQFTEPAVVVQAVREVLQSIS